eukprot:COSAG05_NODE_463_length_9555_cov_35.796108_10_plen_111_part_00
MVMAGSEEATSFPEYLSAKDVEGCWTCCSPLGTGLFYKKANGPDKLFYTGFLVVCFVLPLPLGEHRTRTPGTNDFYKTDDATNVDYHQKPSFSHDPCAMSCRLCKCGAAA